MHEFHPNKLAQTCCSKDGGVRHVRQQDEAFSCSCIEYPMYVQSIATNPLGTNRVRLSALRDRFDLQGTLAP